jgi:hypothetical protein
MAAVRRTVAVLSLLLLLTIGGSGPAMGSTWGGPTSVLLASPGLERTASLYHSHDDYGRLLQLLESRVGAPEVVSGGHSSRHMAGPLVRATWLIHDMYVWRIDRIYPEAPGGPWIGTTLTESSPLNGDERIVWYRIADPRGLVRILSNLALHGSAGKPETPTPPPVNEQPATPATAATAEPSALTGWRWSVLGLVAGAVLTALALRVVPAWRRDHPPRWELIEPEP